MPDEPPEKPPVWAVMRPRTVFVTGQTNDDLWSGEVKFMDEEQQAKYDELLSAAKDVLPMCADHVEFQERSSEDWRAYLRLKRLVEAD